MMRRLASIPKTRRGTPPPLAEGHPRANLLTDS
jgi:hypothetical protein